MKPEFDPLFGALMSDGWFPSPAHVMRRAAILDAFKNYPAGTLLEMGCGAGRMIVDWDRLGHTGCAVDLDPTARGLAAKCAEAFEARFEVSEKPNEAEYDYLVATEVLEHIDEPADAITSWLAYLKPGGAALFTVPAFSRLWGSSDEWAGHVRRFEPAAFTELVEAAGLKVSTARLYGFPIGNVLRIAGNLTSGRKMRRRKEKLQRQDATYASGHDRSTENRLAPLFRSFPGRIALKVAISLQRQFDKGHGLVVTARKPMQRDLGNGS